MQVFQDVLVFASYIVFSLAILIFCGGYFINARRERQARKKQESRDKKALRGMVDFLVKDSPCDICQTCIFLREYTQEEMERLPDDVEPCDQKRLAGPLACRKGIIEYFANKN